MSQWNQSTWTNTNTTTSFNVVSNPRQGGKSVVLHIGLDFETYSNVDLKKHGLARYIESPFFQPLIGRAVYYDRGQKFSARFDLWSNDPVQIGNLRTMIQGHVVVAQNAGFERAVLQWLGIDHPVESFIDSAVYARAMGVSGTLAKAAPQLLNKQKLDAGVRLIKLFSVAHREQGGYQEVNEAFDPSVISDNPVDWDLFGDYCTIDAELGLEIFDDGHPFIPAKEQAYTAVTMEMNSHGWNVDMASVEEMQRRYQENMIQAEAGFRTRTGAFALNLNSLVQLKKWCLDRGIKANSFAEKKVEALANTIDRKLSTMQITDPKWGGYEQVLDMLRTKQVLGGSSLKKLQVIIDTVDSEQRLKDQYVHVGAGQTFRTSGRSVQMQNLKRLAVPANMEELLLDPHCDWTNEELAENMRQVFTATHPQGRLIVGDFSSVESRGLAYLAGETWKLDEYRRGKDMYKVLASQMFSISYAAVVKDQRQAGKVGELSCGYGAGPGAVQSFAAGMGIEMSEGEAAKLVADWRSVNPMIVHFWDWLTAALHAAVESVTHSTWVLPDGMTLRLRPTTTPASLKAQHADAQSIEMVVYQQDGSVFLRRVFHGCYMHGRDVRYYKASERMTGDLWSSEYTDQKTKQRVPYKLYGGKLAGILTQSFCRELFMQSLLWVHAWCKRTGETTLIGQFHDEIVLDWSPVGSVSLDYTKKMLEKFMSDPGIAKSFPLAADIKDDYRYTK